MKSLKEASAGSINNLIHFVSGIVHKETGIQLGEKQFSMIYSRLTKRMLDLGISSPEVYLKYIHEHLSPETKVLISIITTHHTFFFREFSHFEYLELKGLNMAIAGVRARKDKTLRVWSAACSRGQEAYSLAMFLKRHMAILAPDLTFEIRCNDVDADSVNIARNGVYRWEEIKQAPSLYIADHWVRGTGEIVDYVKVKQSIKDHCNFGVLNLFDLTPLGNQKFDIIFCRNVFIYFNHSQIKQITKNILDHLEPHGLFFIALSESLTNLDLPVSTLGPSIYSHKTQLEAKSEPKANQKVIPIRPQTITPAPEIAKIIRVLCIDDSPTVLTLLKKILGKENGFEVVATAKDGIEAKAVLASTKVDAVTLDIHMPNQNGIEYLEKNYNSNHPPVLMVSSVSREESSLGLRALKLGAADYVEKPAMDTIAERADEIRMKLRCAVKNNLSSSATGTNLAASFENKLVIKNPESKLRIILASLGERKKIRSMLDQLSGNQPPTILLLYGSDSLTGSLAQEFSAKSVTVDALENSTSGLKSGMLYLGDFKKSDLYIAKALKEKKNIQVIIFGGLPKAISEKVASWNFEHLIVEEGADVSSTKLFSKIGETIPWTSFAYHSEKHLSRDSKDK